MFVANRRYDRAIGLAQRFGGRAVRFEDLPARARGAPTSSSRSTGSPHQIVGRDELEFVAASRRAARCVLIDIAVPRDIEPSVRDCPGVTLYDMDDLQRAVARNLDAREAEAERGRALVDEEVERFEALAGEPRRRADDLGAARARRRDRPSRCWRENETRWESLSAGRPRARSR